MIRPRFSLRGLMIALVVAAVAIASLRNADDVWAGVMLLSSELILALAILGVVYRRGARRAFWLGFALFGWGYLLQSFDTTRNFGFGPQIDPPLSRLLDSLYPLIHRDAPTSLSTPFLHIFGSMPAKDAAIHRALGLTISIPFATETPLEDFLKYIKAETQSSKLPQGIPIWIDPAGLQEAETTTQSPILLRLEGTPLRASLELALRQLDLRYEVKGGLLQINSIVSSTSRDTVQIVNFHQVGHCCIALVAGLFGGLVGRAFHATSERRDATPAREGN